MSEPVIILIDAFPSTRKIIANMLRQIGLAEIEEADDWQAACSVMERKNVAMVVCNPHKEVDSPLTPSMLAEHIADIPELWVVDADESAPLEGLDHLFKLTKPFSVEELRDKIESMLGI